MSKRVLSVFLSLAMVLSLVVVPVSAAEDGVPTITLSTVSFQEGKDFKEISNIAEAKPGDLIAVKVYFDNQSSNSMYIKSLDLTIEYNGNVFEPYTYSYTEGRDTVKKGPVVVTDLARFSAESNKLNDRDAIKLSAANTSGIQIEASSGEYHDAVLGYYLFKVISDVETTTATFKINGTDDNVKASSTQEETQTSPIEGLTFGSQASIKINGVAPQIETVTLGQTNVTVAGGNTGTLIQATATSAKGTNITTQVRWSIEPPTNVTAEESGVTISKNGDISVGAKAKAGTYKVVARGRTSSGGSGSVSTQSSSIERSTGRAEATLTVTRNRSVPTSVRMSDISDTYIPVNSDTTSYPLSAQVIDQYDDVMGKDDAAVIWSITPTVGGVTITPAGELIIANEAKTAITSSQEFTVTATVNENVKASKTFTVSRQASEASSIELSDNSLNIFIPRSGITTQDLTATVKDQYGETITNPTVEWSISPTVEGVSIDQNGQITVSNAAKDSISNTTGMQFTVTAKSGAKETSATVTVKRATSEATAVVVSGDTDTIEIPVSTADDQTAVFTATVTDQYGSPMPDANVTWSIENSTTGISVDNGTVTVSKDASVIENNREMLLVATYNGIRGTKNITVKRATAVATTIEVNDGANTIEIPGNSGADQTATFTATVKDQYGTQMTNSVVEWSITPEAAGVSIDNAGKITVTNAAKADITNTKDFTVTAKSGSVKGTATVTVKRAPSVATSMKVLKDGTELTGTTDTVIIPSGDTSNTYTYSARVYDQYGSEISSAQPTLSFATASEKVGYNNGTVTVKTGAVKDSTYTLTVSYTGLADQTITITAKDIDITWPTATVAQNPVYGTAWKDIVTGLTGGSAQLNGQQVTGEFTLKNPDSIPDAGSQSYVVNFTGTLNGVQYNIDKTYAAVTIAKKPVTITGLTASDKEYNGNATATPSGTASISGKLDKDELTVVPGTASFADKNVETNKDVTFTGYSLGGAAKDNYVLFAQPATVKANITQKEITVGAGTLHFTKVYDGTTSASSPTGALVLNGVITGDEVSVKTDYTAVYEDANAGDANKVTLSGLTLDGAAAGNYKLNTTTLEIAGNSITKATCPNITVNSQAKYGTTGTLNLSSYLVTGATVGQITTTDSDNVLEGNPYVSDKTLSYQFKSNEALKDKTATITIPVTSNNYNNYSIIVTVTVLDKLPQTNFKFASDQQTKTYGDGKFTYAATGAVDGSTVTYRSSASEVATVDSQTGEVTILKAGTTTITASATATDDYAAAEKSYTLTVNKAKLTIQPKSYTIRVGETLPTPEVEYVGLKNNDKAEDVAKLETDKKLDLEIKNKDKTGALENSNTTGTYEIAFKETPTFQSAENYDIVVVATGTLTINSRSSSNSGGGGVSGYAVSVTTPKNGKVSVKPTSAAKGATVTVTVTPDSGYALDKLTVTDANGKAIATTDKGNGTFTFTMPAGKVSVSASFKQTAVTPPSTGFVDVPSDAYYAAAVQWAVDKGITTGTSATTFSPEASCTRAQMVTFLWRAAGSPAPKSTGTAFTDLENGAYYTDAVLWAVEQGVTTGTSATTFSPNEKVTRGQTVTFLYRFAGQPTATGSTGFTDVTSSDYYAAAVQWAKEQGITSGTSDTTFSPGNDCTRGQIVTFLYRQLGK